MIQFGWPYATFPKMPYALQRYLVLYYAIKCRCSTYDNLGKVLGCIWPTKDTDTLKGGITNVNYEHGPYMQDMMDEWG